MTATTTEKRIDGQTLIEYCDDPERVRADAIAAGIKGEPFTYHHATRGRYNGKTSTRFKALNNLDLLQFAKQRFAD